MEPHDSRVERSGWARALTLGRRIVEAASPMPPSARVWWPVLRLRRTSAFAAFATFATFLAVLATTGVATAAASAASPEASSAAHSGTASAAADDMSSVVTPQAPRRGALYRVEDDATPPHVAWLFGTIHVGKPEWYPLPDDVMTAFGSARRLVVEADLRDTAALAAAVSRHVLYPDGQRLDTQLSPSTYSLLQDAMSRLHLPIAAVAGMRPFAVTTLLSERMLAQQGYRADLGVDRVLMNLASAAGKPIEGIESAESQMQLFSQLSGKAQEAMLRDQLDGMRDGSAQREMQALVTGWAQADSARIEAMLQQETGKGTAMAAWTRDVLVDKRNVHMAQAVEKLLARPGASFVAVGMAHLVGDNGVPRLLARQGLHVRKID